MSLVENKSYKKNKSKSREKFKKTKKIKKKSQLLLVYQETFSSIQTHIEDNVGLRVCNLLQRLLHPPHMRPLPINFLTFRANHKILLGPIHKGPDLILHFLFLNFLQNPITLQTPSKKSLRLDF